MADVTSPLIVNRRRRATIPFREVMAQLLRTGLRSNEEDSPAVSEDGCYASLIIFIAICSLGFAMIVSCMISDHISYGVVTICMIALILLDMGIMLYFIKMQNKWMDVSYGLVLCTSDASRRGNTNHLTINEQCDAVGSSLSASTRRNSLSLVGVYIFGSTSVFMYFVHIIQVTTCIPFFFNEYDTHRYAYEDVLYAVFRTIANAFVCVQIAFFACFKHINFVSIPRFCYSFLLFVSTNFFFLLESLMYALYVRLDIVLPWQSRPTPDHMSGNYDLLCYNATRVFDKSVFVMQDILYPFAIEFYILSIGIFLHHWFNLVPTASRPTRTAILRRDTFDEINSDTATNHQRKICGCFSALPLAVVLSLLMIGSAALLLFQNIVGIVIYVYHIVRLLYQSLLIIPVLLGVHYLSYFRYNRKPSLDGSDMLLVSTVTGAFLVTGFTTVTSSTLLHHFATSDDFDREVTQNFDVTISDSVFCLIYAVINYIQIIIQTCFFVSARRRVPPRCESITLYRLRECFLYIAVCNAFILATDTFIALRTFSVESPTNVWFFGARLWSILESVQFPVAELYHFHSVLLCSELYLSFKVD
ncbi:uncharacterized protein LOC117112798 [Anneissia japonica]|uniref:uncharacterized protein LOC117112798 n=1 Tax=Anneissia japonica TaxID=1529436 RepID=UPI0014259837|nr:uncharacterized protein LOC117112798 [Anneissia japonica]